MKLGSMIKLRKEIRSPLGNGWLVIHKNALGVVLTALPSHPLGPTFDVLFKINEVISIEVLVDAKNVMEDNGSQDT